MNTDHINPLPPSTDEEAAAGNLLPDPVLPPRALAELRLAFKADAPVPEEADLRFLNVLNEGLQRKKRLISFWRGFQIAAVLAIVASFMYYGAKVRDSDRTRIPSINERNLAAQQKDSSAESSPAPTSVPPADATQAPAAAPTPALATLNDAKTESTDHSQPTRNVTILDAFNLARRIEAAGIRTSAPAPKRSAGFTASGERISEIDEVDKLAAAAVGTNLSQVQRARRSENQPKKSEAKAEPFARAPQDGRSEVPAVRADKAALADKHVRILSYDIMLDVGSRSLAAFQVEVTMSAPDTAMVTFMGARGGEHPALQRKPFYDTDRVRRPGSRVTFNIANFDTGRELPTGDVRVARLVLVVVGNGTPGVSAKLVVAAGPDGVPIPAGLRVAERPAINNPEEVQKTLEADGD